MEENELMMEGTTPTEEAETEPTVTEEAESAPQETEETTEGEEIDAEPTEINNDSITLHYMHEDLNVPKEEAVRLAQMGKHYEDTVMPLLDDLDYFATLQGKSVKELVKELVDGVEKSYREELTYQLGGDSDLIEEMMELRRSKNRKHYEEKKAARAAQEQAAEEEATKSATTRLAEQFESIREAFPEYDSVEKVPDSVFKEAMKSGDLEKALLRFELSERKKVEAAKTSAEKNKTQNIGSGQSTPAEDNSMSAFMKGLWG